MDKQAAFQKIVSFILIKIIVAVVIIVGLIALVEWLGRAALDKTTIAEDIKQLMVAVAEAVLALSAYVLLFQKYEHRKINELSAHTFGTHAGAGLLTGLFLQAFFIFVIFLAGTYSVVQINAASALLPSLAFAITAGFVAEILLIGVLFRLLEEKAGTRITLAIFIVLFAVLHVNSKGATVLSVCATAAQAGFLLPAAYVFSRSVWLPIFIHVGWDLAEPGIFGAINPSTSLTGGLFTSKITGLPFLTGGQTGPQNSIQSLILCLVIGMLLLYAANRRNKFIQPAWRKRAGHAVEGN